MQLDLTEEMSKIPISVCVQQKADFEQMKGNFLGEDYDSLQIKVEETRNELEGMIICEDVVR